MLVQVDVADPVAGHYNPRNDVILRLEYINARHTKARSLEMPHVPGLRRCLAAEHHAFSTSVLMLLRVVTLTLQHGTVSAPCAGTLADALPGS